jgi:hypothetical protein
MAVITDQRAAPRSRVAARGGDPVGGGPAPDRPSPAADPPARHHQGLRPGQHRLPGAQGGGPGHRRRRVRGHHGAQRLGQVHRHEHPRLPGHAQRRRLPVPRRARAALDATSARACAGATWASCSRASTCWRAPRRRRTWSCRCSTAASRRPRHAAARAALAAVGLARAGSTTRRPSSRAASSSAWRSRAPSSPSRGAAGRRAHRQPRHPAQPRDHGAALALNRDRASPC